MGIPELTGLDLIDVYEGEKIPAGKVSLTLRLTFQDREKTLTVDRVQDFIDTVLSFLIKYLWSGAQILMNETKPQWELTGLERFGHLEDKIFRMVEEFKAVRKDNEILRAENHAVEGANRSAARIMNPRFRTTWPQYQKEREELRERVEKALTLLATLEAR